MKVIEFGPKSQNLEKVLSFERMVTTFEKLEAPENRPPFRGFSEEF